MANYPKCPVCGATGVIGGWNTPCCCVYTDSPPADPEPAPGLVEELKREAHDLANRWPAMVAMQKAADRIQSDAVELARVALERDEAREQFDNHVAWASEQVEERDAKIAALRAALADALLCVELVRMQARRRKDIEQEIEAQDCMDRARAALGRGEG